MYLKVVNLGKNGLYCIAVESFCKKDTKNPYFN